MKTAGKNLDVVSPLRETVRIKLEGSLHRPVYWAVFYGVAYPAYTQVFEPSSIVR